jgi:hypothetical protein
LDSNLSDIEVPLGLGSRHIAAALITSATNAAAIVVSESSIVRVFEHGALIAEIIPELWLFSRHKLALRGRISTDQQRHIAIITGVVVSESAASTRSIGLTRVQAGSGKAKKSRVQRLGAAR